MSGARLPSVRLPAIVAGQVEDEEGAEAVVMDLPPSSRFGIAWPAEPQPPISISTAERPATVSLSSSEGETDISEDEPSAQSKGRRRTAESDGTEYVTPTSHLHADRDPMEQVGYTLPAPRMSRALSMHLPSQLGPFRNPRRVASSANASPTAGPSEEPAHLQELSLELADSVQMVIQTLLQLSPPQVLDPAKEQFSACSLSIPTPSVSAMLTSMKNLNYMSANMSTFSLADHLPASATASGRPKAESGTRTYVDFDVGEMLQSVGDALSGIAAQAGVDLVLFHDDLAMRHVAVKGDENGLSYTLSHILRQIISVSKSEDSIEIGLFIESVKASRYSPSLDTVARSNSPIDDTDGPLRCSFRITHRFGTQDPNVSSGTGSAETGEDRAPSPVPSSRNKPTFKTLILSRLLHHVDADLEPEVLLKDMLGGHCSVLTTTLDRGAPSVVNPNVDLSPEDAAYLGYPVELCLAHEPTLEQLTQFAESLKGRKVTLMAHSKGSFAQHLTSYLTAWGLDVGHVSTGPDADDAQETEEKMLHDESTTRDSVSPPSSSEQPSATAAPVHGTQPAEPFILIDDDVSALRSKLQQIRAAQAYPLNLHSHKRPSLATHHRPRSSPQVARVMGLTPQPQSMPQVVIVHFTSLANFKLVKDAIQSMIVSGNTWTRLPEVIVVPKPAGPRRILTALHTAVTKPIVDPFFAPIATSPLSPSYHPTTSLFSAANVQRSPGGRSTGSFRISSDRSVKSPKDGSESVGPAPSSPLGMTDNMEYFSDAVSKLGASPSSGLFIQSPNGQPAGIFFHPKSKGKSSPHTERGPPISASDSFGRPRGSSYRRTSDSEGAKKGIAVAHTDIPRRSPRPPLAQGVPPSEVAYEKESPITTTKGKARQIAIADVASEEPEPVSASSPLEPAGPKLSRKAAQDPRHSPPLSPQARTTGGATAARRAKRPTAETAASAPAAITKKGIRGGEGDIVPPISVLVVDDNPINQTILSTFMKKKKIKYDVANNGEEAVQKWRSGGFHLILMDIKMPVMDGIQATQEIRRLEKSNGVGGFPTTPQSEGQQTPSEASTETRSASTPSYRSSVIIVALTASALASDRVAALAAGCNDFLTKPVSLDWLNSKIIEWGSIKALQMWADIRPEVVRSITTGQAAQARDVASRLHVPEGRSTPVVPRSRSSSQSRKAVSLDAAMAAATSLSKADKSIAPTPRPDITSGPTSGSSLEAGAVPNVEVTPPVRRCDTIPEVSSSDQLQTPHESEGDVVVVSVQVPLPTAESDDRPQAAGNAFGAPAQVDATSAIVPDDQPKTTKSAVVSNESLPSLNDNGQPPPGEPH